MSAHILSSRHAPDKSRNTRARRHYGVVREKTIGWSTNEARRDIPGRWCCHVGRVCGSGGRHVRYASRSIRAVFLSALMLLLASCAGGKNASPVSPDRGEATYTLSGIVSERTEAGEVPVEGVLVAGYRCSRRCEGQESRTDSHGAYSMSLYAGENDIWIIKDGYYVDGPPPTRSCENCDAIVAINGDPR